MNKEQAEQLLQKHKWVPPAGCSYFPTPITSWMIDAVLEAYAIGIEEGKEYVRDGE